MKRILKAFLLMITLVMALSLFTACFKAPPGSSNDDDKNNETNEENENKEEPKTETFTVTFDLAGGEAPAGFTVSVTVNKDATVTLPAPTREGHNFLGWYNGNAAFTADTKITANTTLTAKWQERTYTVTFVYPDGEVINTQVTREGSIPTEPAEPTKVGHAFLGWYTDSDLTNEYSFVSAFDNDVTLYARMVAGFTAIKTAEDLNNIRLIPTANYILRNDIDLGATEWAPIETFSGIIDGDGHKINNLKLIGSENRLGFIKTNDGTVQNIIFDNAVLDYDRDTSNGNKAYAGVISSINNGTIKDCNLAGGQIEVTINSAGYNNGNSDADFAYIGAIAGRNCGIVSQCENNINLFVDITVKNSGDGALTLLGSRIGGIVGESNGGAIERTKASGNITCTNTVISTKTRKEATHVFRVGGIAGCAYNNCEISNCLSSVDINISNSGNSDYARIDTEIGVILGRADCEIINCVAKGKIDISNTAKIIYGGIAGAVGLNVISIMSNVFADVDITVSGLINIPVGGLVGENAGDGQISKSVSVGDISVGKDTTDYGHAFGKQIGTAHFCYYSTDSSLTQNGEAVTATCTAGEGRALSELQSAEFIFDTLGWDSEIWQINEGANPTLKCFAG